MIEELFSKQYTLFDGGMGTMLMKRGLKPGDRSDMMNIEHPEVVRGIHAEYVEAGSEILCTNTFSSCSETLKGSGASAEKVIAAAVKIAKEAAGGKALVAIDIGPTGEFMEPYGDLTYERAYARFSEQAKYGKAYGADLAAVETMSTVEELEAAVNAAVDAGLPTLATMTFTATGRTFAGCSIEDFAAFINDSNVIASGLNCSLSPAEMYPTAEKLAAILKKPLIIKLNAGLPKGDGTYSVSPEEFARQMESYKALNVRLIGGCCGTTPDYIRCLSEVFKG